MDDDLYFFVAIEPLGGSMPEIKTIKVVNPDGPDYMIINESDFDKTVHVRWEQRKQTKPKSKAETVQTSNESFTVIEGDPILSRINELEELYKADGWRPIADLGESLKIEKPAGGWRDAIPLIAQREQETLLEPEQA